MLRKLLTCLALMSVLPLAACGGSSGPTATSPSCQSKLAHPPLVRAGSLIASINPTVPPIQYVDDQGNIIGLDPDLGQLIAKRLCLKLELVSIQFATMIPGVQDGRFDMIDSFMFYTPARASQVLMIPYGASTIAIVVPKGKGKVIGPQDFSGKKFAVELGTVDAGDADTASKALVAAGKPPIEIHTFNTYADVLQALKAGQVDGAFIGTEEAFYYQKQPGASFFDIALTGYDPHAEALAFKDQSVAQAVADAMNAAKADGSLDKLFNSYHHCSLPGPYKIMTGPLTLSPTACAGLQ
jgi:polar amino acid transport system substrate-binding protein